MAMQIIAWRARSPSSPRAANSGATLGGRWGLTAQRGRAEGAYMPLNAKMRPSRTIAHPHLGAKGMTLMFKQSNSHTREGR